MKAAARMKSAHDRVPAASARVLQRQCACGGKASGGPCPKCEDEKRRGVLQRSAAHDRADGSVPPIVHEVLSEPGQPLDAGARAFFEPQFGTDFSGVRVHTGHKAAQSADAVNARAYTVGRHIFVRDREPGSVHGVERGLLAHELTHVVQQRNITEAGDVRIAAIEPCEREARAAAQGEIPGHVTPATAGGTPLQRAADGPDESLGFLDSRVADVVAAKAIGSDVAWAVLKEAIRGFVVETRGELAKGRGNRISARFRDLLTSPTDILAFSGGYRIGVLEGLVSPITDLWHLLKFSVETQLRMIRWVANEGADFFRDPAGFKQHALALLDSFDAVLQEAGDTVVRFLKNPIEGLKQIKGLLDAIMSAARSQARDIGQGVAEAVFQFLELPWHEFGQKIGYVIGAAVVQVLMLVFTKAIGNALSALGRMLATAGKWAVSEAAAALRLAGSLAGKLIEMLKALSGSVLKLFEGLAAKLIELFQRAKVFFESVVDGLQVGPKLAVEGGGSLPSNVLLAERIKPPTGGRTTLTAVEELTGKGTSRGGGTVTKEVKTVAEPEELLLSESELVEQPGVRVRKPTEIRQAEAAFGREFDVLQGQKYPANQVPIRDRAGKLRRLDSYDPVKGEIISRKSLEASNGQLADVDVDTAIGHFQEFPLKYRSGATIADVPSARKVGLAGQVLKGQYVLEVPVQRYPIPDNILREAANRGVLIRDINGKVY
jgi:hypothetical protein